MLLDTPVIFFGGKGGVGKTTLAAATALRLSDTQPTLLVSTDPAHNIGHIFDATLSDSPTALTSTLSAMELDPTEAANSHIAKVEDTMRTMMPERLHGEVRKHLTLARTSPGTHEAALLERIADVVLNHRETFSHIVIDTAPTGHTSRLLALPELLGAWTDGLLKRRGQSEKFGEIVRGFSGEKERSRDAEIRGILTRRKHLFNRFREVIQDPATTSFGLVTLPEKMPVSESIELYHTLQHLGVNVGGVYINRCSPTDQGAFLAARAEQEASYIAELDQKVDVKQQRLPLLLSAEPGEIARLI
ncbi:Arsenical pump-driving ATPase [Corynebacterium ciconiae DSM 44920]|uniref:ArsA family ATPase n=1 Tax=Corynebacterium ciconiae TaxID=227319 RepID=UPI00036B19C5|nr:ArsA family ATPase [Corynebacterium ciconiae]WKD60111.1 Arsenical pump-driving ATPase [Corynebacterium ciconiae DSM 44920]